MGTNQKENKLVYLQTYELMPHPDNPRKDLGDLSELTESIKASGIMQNLTVVPRTVVSGTTGEPYQNGYTVIIGHRRLAAAKKAGLAELPCVIVDMDERQQMATMMAENMQRADLTVYEQAQGIQMMLDLGETVETISEKTGFSASTVRRRMKLNELDQKALQKAAAKQISFADLDKLSKIEDIKERNKLLGAIGTNNFDYSYKSAMDDQEKKKKEAAFRALAKQRGYTEITDTFNLYNKYKRAAYLFSTDEAALKKLDELPEGEVYFFHIGYGSMDVYRKNNAEDDREKAEIEEKNARQRAIVAELSAAAKRACELRRDFIRDFPKAEAKKRISEILCLALRLMQDIAVDVDSDLFGELVGNEDGVWDWDCVDSTPEYSFLCAVWASADTGTLNYYRWNAAHEPNWRLDTVYEFLKALGYEMSDEEIALQNGTSWLFKKEDA